MPSISSRYYIEWFPYFLQLNCWFNSKPIYGSFNNNCSEIKICTSIIQKPLRYLLNFSWRLIIEKIIANTLIAISWVKEYCAIIFVYMELLWFDYSNPVCSHFEYNQSPACVSVYMPIRTYIGAWEKWQWRFRLLRTIIFESMQASRQPEWRMRVLINDNQRTTNLNN